MKLTKNFSLEELYRSNTAKRNGLDNTPNAAVAENLGKLALIILQPLRDALGPVHVECGYRSPAVNKAVGGASTSQHMTGEAADLDNDGLVGPTNKEMFDYIRKNLSFDQLICEFPDAAGNPSWVHVSYKGHGPQRGQVLKAVKQGGVTKYLPI